MYIYKLYTHTHIYIHAYTVVTIVIYYVYKVEFLKIWFLYSKKNTFWVIYKKNHFFLKSCLLILKCSVVDFIIYILTIFGKHV